MTTPPRHAVAGTGRQRSSPAPPTPCSPRLLRETFSGGLPPHGSLTCRVPLGSSARGVARCRSLNAACSVGRNPEPRPPAGRGPFNNAIAITENRTRRIQVPRRTGRCRELWQVGPGFVSILATAGRGPNGRLSPIQNETSRPCNRCLITAVQLSSILGVVLRELARVGVLLGQPP